MPSMYQTDYIIFKMDQYVHDRSLTMKLQQEERNVVCTECSDCLKIPLAAEIWKIFSDPLLTIYSNLDKSSLNLSCFLKTILKCSREMTDLFIPKAYDHRPPRIYGIREEQYRAFAIWLLGQVFFINGKLKLAQLHAPSINVQVKCVHAISYKSNYIFAAVFEEYLLVLLDLLAMKRANSYNIPLERFIPNFVEITEQLKLTPIEVQIKDEHVAKSLTETVLNIMKGILHGVTTLSENIFLKVLLVLTETIKEWDTSIQAASVKVASELYRLKVLHFDDQINDVFCNCIGDLINIRIPFICSMGSDGKTYGLIENLFELFIAMLEQERPFYQQSDLHLIRIIWSFVDLECMDYYTEKRIHLMEVLSSCFLPKIPAHLINFNLIKKKISQVETFLYSIFSLEHCLRNEVLSNMQNFINGLNDHQSKHLADKLWSVDQRNSTWKSFIGWYDVFSTAELKSYPIYFAAVTRLSCHIIKIATKIFLAIEDRLVNTPIPTESVEISFFGEALEKIFLTFVKIMETLEDEEEHCSSFDSWGMIFRALGNLLKIPDANKNMNKKDNTALALLSLPWNLEEKPVWEDGLFITEETLLSLQKNLPEVYRTRLQHISLNYLCYVDRNIAFSWRLEILKKCLKSDNTDLVIAAINTIPFYLMANFKLDFAQELAELLNLSASSENVLIIQEVSKMIVPLTCTLSGFCVVRNSNDPDPEYELICSKCKDVNMPYPNQDCSLMDNIHTILINLFKLFESNYAEVRLEMAKSVPRITNHLDITNNSQLLSACLKLLEDPDYSVRLDISDNIICLIIPRCWSVKIHLFKHNIVGSNSANTQLIQAIKWFNLIFPTIYRIFKQSLIDSKKENQETMLIAIKNIGSIKVDYVLFPIVKLMVLFVIHPLSLIQQPTTAAFTAVSKIHQKSPLHIFEKYRIEICELISCMIKLSVSKHFFRLSSLAKKMSSMFEFGNTYDFLNVNLQYILPPLIPWIAKYRKLAALSEFSFFLSLNTSQLLTNQFRYIYPYLYLNEDEHTLHLCLNYMKEVGSLNIPHVKNKSSEAIQNILILDLHIKSKRVLSGLAEFVRESNEQKQEHEVTDEEVADFLQPRILGILLFLDSHITIVSACQWTRQKALACLPELFKFMGPKRLTPIKFKILATLKTSLRITNGDFPLLICNAWEAFVNNVELASLGSLLSQIFISLLRLLDKFPEKIRKIFSFLVIENKDVMKKHIPDLYFVPNHGEIRDVYNVIQDHIAELWPEDFRKCFILLLKYITHDHVDVKINGLKKLRQFLKEHQNELKDFVLNFGNEDTILGELIEALIIGCRDRDSRVRIACGECFGEMGAIDSARLPQSSAQKGENLFILDLQHEDFAVAALTKFLKAFMSARDTADMDRFAFAIQVFLKTFLSTYDSEAKRKKFWSKFPENLQQIMKPFTSTLYMLESENCDIWKPHPIFGSNAGTSFQQWAYRWVCNMVTIEDDEFNLKILSACRACLKFDMNVLIFLLPHIFLNAVIKANEEQSWKLIEEIMAVMSSPSIDSKESTSSAIVNPVKLKSYLMTESHPDSPKEMRVMCLNTVFSLIDYLFIWLREWKHIFGKKDISATKKDQRPVIVKSFLNKLCKLTVANKNFECREYPRALLYLEQYVEEKSDQLGEQYHFFEKIYARLNEPDAVAGVLAVQNQPPTFEQLILSHEANGQLQDAATCYEKMAQSGCSKTGYALGMVNCYLKLDQPHAALGLISGLSVQRPDLTEMLIESSVESLWKMSNWAELEKCIKSTDGILNNLWSVSIGNALLSLRNGDSDTIPHIDLMRKALMNSLCAISINNGAYVRGYQFIVRCQILSEIERASEVIFALRKKHVIDGLDDVKNFLKEWEGKLKLVQDSMSTLEPILCVRRMILSIFQETVANNNKDLLNLIQNEIGRFWIKSAEIARNSGYFQQSYMYILNAEKCNLKNVFIEKAKLFWDKDDTNLALSTLRKGIAEKFPNAAQFKVLKDKIPLEDRKICAEAKLLLARFNDENINADIDDNLQNYNDSVETYQKWEKNLVYLAQYYDRILDAINADDEEKGRQSQLHMINCFGKSLEFGCEYLFHSMPRMLTIWLDYGAKIENKDHDKGEIFVKMTKLIETYSHRLPPFMFFSAFSQITTRLCHPHPLVFAVLKNIIANVIITFPHQSLWMIMAVLKSSNTSLSRKCNEIFSICKKREAKIVPVINDYVKLTEHLIALCNKQAPDAAHQASLSKLSPVLSQMFKNPSNSKMSLPLQKFISITMPLDLDIPQTNHNPFPKEPVYITGIEDKIFIFSSLQKPKKISFRGSDGNNYPLLCKSKDDLRKDSRVMEFNRIVNLYLRSDAEACQRCLHIRTYSVVPLNEDCGVIEWIPNLIGLRSLLSEIYSKMGLTVTSGELRKLMCALKDPLHKKKSVFLEKLIPKHPPVFDMWFYRTFSDPQGWYMARNAYIRTTAVMSIVGYVLGLGDRHGENILFDSVTGDTVHVDLSCIFNMGEKFNWPEKVPFRLTHNMVKAMGSNGIEGIFRRSCEITMRILKCQSTTLIAVLTPFVYDPSMSSSSSSSDLREFTNKVAREHLHNINQRLQGYVSTKGGKFSLPLSTEGQVEKLISEATSVDNLCQMYIGWGAYL